MAQAIYIKALALGLLMLACSPGTKKDTRDSKELLADEKASASVPLSGTNLVFSVQDEVALESLDAYIVGYPSTLFAKSLGNRRFIIENVPAGTRDVIVTGAGAGAALQGGQTFDRGLRIRKELGDGELVDLGTLALPKTGAMKGRLEMEGVSSFQTVQVAIPGTKFSNVKPQPDGSYDFTNLPVGLHDLGALQSENPIEAKGAGNVESEAQKQAARFIVRSVPNVPNNLTIVPRNNNLLLSWNSGGGESAGYLLFKSTLADASFKPENGKTYETGSVPSGDIIYIGETPYFSDPAVKNGTSYYYHIYAFNKDRVFSSVLKGSAAPRAPDYQYQSYRLYIDSTASDCDLFGSSQVQSLRFHIDNIWQVNDFSSATNSGKIGPYPVVVSSNSVYSPAYEPFYAFMDDNNPWSSTDDAFAIVDPFDANLTLFPQGVYFTIQFAQGPVEISGLEILGGEPPFMSQCAPDRYHMEGSNDGGVTWTMIPGSTRSQPTITRVRYFFSPQTKPLAPNNLRLLASSAQVELKWERGAGAETGFMVVRSTQPVPFQPESGRPYNAGRQGVYDIVYQGTDLEYLDTKGLLADGTVYYYAVFAYDAAFNYATPVVGRAVPEARTSYRYYRFVVDSILGGEGQTNYLSWMDDLKLQIDGRWIDSYAFTSETGTINGAPVTVTESSVFTSADKGWQVFGPGQWMTADKTFASAKECMALRPGHEWIQLDFGSKPVAITGVRYFGNNASDPVTGDFSSEKFGQIPDQIHVERSTDGLKWERIRGSDNSNLAAEIIEVEW